MCHLPDSPVAVSLHVVAQDLLPQGPVRELDRHHGDVDLVPGYRLQHVQLHALHVQGQVVHVRPGGEGM